MLLVMLFMFKQELFFRIENKIDFKTQSQQLAAAALSAANSSLAAAVATSAIQQNGNTPQTAVVSSNISINYSTTNGTNDDDADHFTKNQKYFSGEHIIELLLLYTTRQPL